MPILYTNLGGEPLDAAQIATAEQWLAAHDADPHDEYYEPAVDGVVCARLSARHRNPEAPIVSQHFAVAGRYAVQLLDGVASNASITGEYVPVLRDGQAIVVGEQALHLFRVRARRGTPVTDPQWIAAWYSGGWVRADELALSAAEIDDRIAAEIDDGATWITGASDRYEGSW